MQPCLRTVPVFGIGSYTFPWAVGVAGQGLPSSIGPDELLQLADSLGAVRLQLADNLPVHTLPEHRWQSVLTEAASRNIQIELGMRGLTEDRLLRYLSLATDCNSPFLRVVIDGPGYTPGHDEIIGTLRAVLPGFTRAGVCLAIENHDRFRAQELVDIIAATDSTMVGICLDTANSLGANESIYEVTRLLAPHTVNLHVKDYCIRRFDHQMGFTVEGRAAGDGQCPIAWLLAELAPYGKCQSAILETWSLPLDTIVASIAREQAWAERGATFLRGCLHDLYQLHQPSLTDEV
ncbi:sugar phosphate isomerase/epimerase family protein [Neolewinella sp.]|uniref:sugar phosphate isomerase/epimerase family protein n=1 Tax=Neolewinella sp. TaxID=2993543 RepID=UPI003B527D17